MFVYTWYKLSMSVYGYVFVWKCKLCLPVFVRWTCGFLYICMNKCCIHLQVSSVEKLLGVTIGNTLCWDAHIE